MRFTPVTFFGSGDTESCISVRGIGAVSESFSCNGVNWDVLMYSASQQSGGSGAESFQFYVDNGSTTHAIVAVVGGGGGGSSDGNAGGGGGVTVETEVTLKQTEGVPYNVQIGQGADGTSRLFLPGTSFSGDDGQTSIFGSPYMSITAGGGEGGIFGGNGGDSGNGNTSTGEGGAGAATGSNDNYGGTGYTIYKNLAASSLNKIVRAGGGGDGENFSGTPKFSHNYGGGDSTSKNGKGGQKDDLGVVTYGGGGQGGQYYRAVDDTYFSSTGGGGFIMIAVPTNLCESSLYSKGNIVTQNLLSNFDANHATSFGKNFYSRFFKDTQRITSLGNSSTSPNTYQDFFQSNIDDGSVIFSDNGSVTVLSSVESVGNNEVNYSLTGSLPLECSNKFTFEWTGNLPTFSGVQNSEVLVISSTSTNANFDLHRENDGEGSYVRWRYNDGTTSVFTDDVPLNEDTHQHTLTFDGTTLRYYLDASLTSSISTTVTSSLDIPNVEYFYDNREPYYFSSSRFYVSDLNSTEIEQNYSASLGL
jgi:hypothetical protein